MRRKLSGCQKVGDTSCREQSRPDFTLHQPSALKTRPGARPQGLVGRGTVCPQLGGADPRHAALRFSSIASTAMASLRWGFNDTQNPHVRPAEGWIMQQAACGSSRCHISPIETDSVVTGKTNKFHIAGGDLAPSKTLKRLIEVVFV